MGVFRRALLSLDSAEFRIQDRAVKKFSPALSSAPLGLGRRHARQANGVHTADTKLHRTQGSRAHSRSPALSNIFPGVHLQRILHRTGRKTTVATTRDSKLSLVSVDELIFPGRFACSFVLYPRAYFHPSLHIISLSFPFSSVSRFLV